MSRIEAIQLKHSTFVPQPAIQEELRRSDSIWHGAKKQRVVLRVSAEVATYFKRRKLVPNQVIETELDSGDLLVATEVTHADEVLPIVRYWIPHLRVLEPAEFQQHMESGLNEYLKGA